MPNSREHTAEPELRLTALDDYPWHQSITPFPLPATSDIHFNDGYLESADIHYRQGRLLNHVLRYTQLARVTGTLTANGRVVEVNAWHGNRDHSWGIRASMGPRIAIRGLEASRGDPRAIRISLPFEVGEHTGFFALHEDVDGRRLDFDGMLLDAGGHMIDLIDVRHAFRYVEGTRRLQAGEYVLVDEYGGEHRYSFEVVCDPASPQGYGYVRGWADGEPPGVWRGAEHLEHDRFDVSDPYVTAGPDHVSKARRLGACEYPVAITGPDGATGMAQIEHMIYGPYRPYGFA